MPHEKAIRETRLPIRQALRLRWAAIAIVFLLAPTTLPVIATLGPVLTPGQVDIHGPRLESITYTVEGLDGVAATDLSTGSINVFDLSFGVAAWTSLTALSVQKGTDSTFQMYGIYFNMLRPVTNTTSFHRAISELWNQSQFESAYLSGVAGYTTPAVMPCQAYPTSCDKTGFISSNPTIFPASSDSTELGLAAASLRAAGLVPTDGIGGPIITSFSFPTSVNSSTYWHFGNSTGPEFVPNWWPRSSLGRNFFSDYISANAQKIGLHINVHPFFSLGTAITHVILPSRYVVVKDGAYVPGKPVATCTTWGCPGYNTRPDYNFSMAQNDQADSWDMYSYGFEESLNFVSLGEAFNSAFGTSGTNPTNYHTPQMDFASNGVIYAKTVGQAVKSAKQVALIQLQDLPFLNIYQSNTLWAALINGWTGYADLPGTGPSTGAGLRYTSLNLVHTCYMSTNTRPATSQTCVNGGNAITGLGDLPNPGGGLSPLYGFSTAYDSDIWQNIYDSPLATPPNGFKAPLKFMNWMTSSYKTKSFTGLTGTGAGWFDMQGAGPLNIVGGKIYTFNFLPNVYFSDHVQMTAYDYNYSLFQFFLPSVSPLTVVTPSIASPYTPSVLMATYISPSNPLQIQVYVNSSSVWNLADLQMPVLPAHIFETYFNPLAIVDYPSFLDTAQNPPTAIAAAPTFTSGKPATPAWLFGLPNLEVGTGSFILRTTNETWGTTTLLRNPNYYRTYWQLYSFNSTNSVPKGTPYSLNLSVYEWSYSLTNCPSGDHACKIPMNSTAAPGPVIGSYQVVKGNAVKASGLLECSDGICTATIDTTALPKGNNEVIVTLSYSYLGLDRVWYQQYGFRIT